MADRDASLTDPAFREVPSNGCSIRATPRSSRRGSTRAGPPGRRPRPTRRAAGRSTSRRSTREGNAVSLIESNYLGFGSGVVDPGTGIHYQNRGSRTSAWTRHHPNRLEPGKRTLHTLLPGMLFRDGQAGPWVVAGSMGGDAQPQIHAQLVSALVDGGVDVATAVAAPRWYVEPADALRAADRGPPRARHAPGIAEALEALGHPVTSRPSRSTRTSGTSTRSNWSTAARRAPDGSVAAATDPRSAGLPAVW